MKCRPLIPCLVFDGVKCTLYKLLSSQFSSSASFSLDRIYPPVRHTQNVLSISPDWNVSWRVSNACGPSIFASAKSILPITMTP